MGFLNCGSVGLALKSLWYDNRLAGRSFAKAPVNRALPNWSRTMGTGVSKSSRGIGAVNLRAVPNGLRGVPVGTAANALRANGLRPFFQARNPPAVKSPHL